MSGFVFAQQSVLLPSFDLALEGFNVTRLEVDSGTPYLSDGPIDTETLTETAILIDKVCESYEGFVWVANSPEGTVNDATTLLFSFNIEMIVYHQGTTSPNPTLLGFDFVSNDGEVVGKWSYVEQATTPFETYLRLEMCSTN